MHQRKTAIPGSMILCVKLTRKNYVNLTRENYALRKDETPSFIAFLEMRPFLSIALYAQKSAESCYLAPLPQHSLHIQSAHPSNMFHDLMGYRSLTVANETFIVRDLDVSDNSNNLNPGSLFKIDLKTNDYPVLKVPLLQRISTFVHIIARFVVRCRFILGSLAAYAAVIAFLSIMASTDKQILYLAIWTFCFMPLIYEIRMNPYESYQALGIYEGIFVRMIIVFIGFAVSLYPALQPIL